MAFSMDVAPVVPVVAQVEEEIKAEVSATPEEVSALKQQAVTNVEEIINMDTENFQQRREVTSSIDGYGADTMKRSAEKNSLLSVSVGKLSQSGGEGGQVSKSLVDLEREIKTLDPSGFDFTQKGLLGKLFNPINNYFGKYEKVDNVIGQIVESLDKGKKTLINDNTTLEIEEASLRDLTKKLNKEIEMGMLMDEEIVRRLEIAQSENQPEDKIKFIQEEVLFPLRQKIGDMQQLTVVNHQGIIAMEVVRRNNRELIRGVDRAKTVTVSALRTAVMVASALYNQKIVLKKLQVLDETTNTLIAGTSRMLKEQGAEIQKQSLESGISPDTLKAAFEDVMTALNDISRFKQDALPIMQSRITAFRELADKGESEIARLERGSQMAHLT